MAWKRHARPENMLKRYNDKYFIYSKTGQKGMVVVDTVNRFMACVDAESKITEAITRLEKQKTLKTVDEIKNYARKDARINIAYYNITYHCNLKCKYCYAMASEKSHVTMEDNEKILAALAKMEVKSLTLIGGEPFCHPNLLGILESAVKKSFEEIVIVTNGTMLPDKLLAFCSENKIKIQVSLDGLTEKVNSLTRSEGSFQRVFANIQKIKAAGIPLKVMQTITKENIRYAFGLYRHFKSRKIAAGFFIVKDNMANNVHKPELRQIKSLMDKLFAEEKDILRVFDIVKISDNMFFGKPGFPILHCGAGINSITVSPKGDVYPCVKLCEKEFNMGSLLAEDPQKAFIPGKSGCGTLPFVDEMAGCGKCRVKFLCGGGCRAEHFRAQKAFCGGNCVYYKELLWYFFDKILYRYASSN